MATGSHLSPLAAHVPGPVLLTSSVGGHFTELEHVADVLEIDHRDRHWVVPRHIQTEDRLARESVTWSPLVQSREFAKALRNLRFALALHRRLRPRVVVSTGAAQAAPHLLAAALCRTPIFFVESVARLDGPSVTGRLAAALPKTRLLAPQPGWAAPWEYEIDAFSAFQIGPSLTGPHVASAVVALGSEHYSFHRAVEAVERVVPSGVDITWQIGDTACADDVPRNRWLTADQMTTAMEGADVVITHGGAGSILTALGAGKVPVVLPRRAEYGEHVDDHQVRMVASLAARGLVVQAHPEELTVEHLQTAAALGAVRGGRTVPALALDQNVA